MSTFWLFLALVVGFICSVIAFVAIDEWHKRWAWRSAAREVAARRGAGIEPDKPWPRSK